MRLPSLRALSFCIAIGAFVLVAVGAPSGQSGAPPAGGRTAPAATTTAPAAMRETSHTLLNRYCVSCHNDAVKTANLSLQGVDLANVPADAAVWEKVIRKLRLCHRDRDVRAQQCRYHSPRGRGADDPADAGAGHRAHHLGMHPPRLHVLPGERGSEGRDHPAEIMRMRALATGHQVEGLTGGLEVR